MADTAKVLGTAPSTLHRWLNDGFIAGEQLTRFTSATNCGKRLTLPS